MKWKGGEKYLWKDTPTISITTSGVTGNFQHQLQELTVPALHTHVSGASVPQMNALMLTSTGQSQILHQGLAQLKRMFWPVNYPSLRKKCVASPTLPIPFLCRTQSQTIVVDWTLSYQLGANRVLICMRPHICSLLYEPGPYCTLVPIVPLL